MSHSFKADSPNVDWIEEAVNFGERRGVDGPDILLLHYTGMDSGDGALKWLCCEESGVSCHYLIFEDGRTLQMVPERLRAHHAGAGSWEGREDVNSRSIGIEIVNGGHPAGLPEFPPEQMQAVADLSRDIIKRHGIAAHRVLGHSDIAPGRKVDPGEAFDWSWLSQQGVGLWVEPVEAASGLFLQEGDAGDPVQALQGMLELYGYGLECGGNFDRKTRDVVEAFQRHFRPKRVDGVADIATIATLKALLDAKLLKNGSDSM
ncbi:N-acetylmuramoyl-L-alanine amidase [Ahrensia sp. R2A130]|uniref:N-acetylmuramoyl-L-alanine amidase n=1 Tax=Ahrensia sp. R2A130 TaxID=744979 RepID=UPI0001E0D0B4|nr:N-acetylmuramoyl-L-alanine amidase [Ahrensia sp. R2A130]EFL90853.1 N-acetylmuramoyl-L-alanine amidase AmiD [Ahrensia sp. R2A130]